MNSWYFFLFVIAVATNITRMIIVSMKEKGKLKRIEKLKDLPNSKIEAIANYEKKSKGKKYFDINKSKDKN